MTKYKTVFASAQIRQIQPSEEQKNEAFASLADLQRLLPFDARPEEEPDLLYIVANLAVGGTVNKNDDGVDIETVLATYKRYEKKQCNLEHNRKVIVGYILKAGLSEFGTDRIITEDEARASGKPFNVTTVAVIWRVAAAKLCNYIEESYKEGKDAMLSLSFEVGFDDYKIIGLPKDSNVVNDQLFSISSSDPRFEMYDACMRGNGGTGIKDGAKLARLLQDIIPLGQGIVAVPAADVYGIAPITHSLEPYLDLEHPETPVEATAPATEPVKAEVQMESQPDMKITSLAFNVEHKLCLDEICASLSTLKQIFEKISKY